MQFQSDILNRPVLRSGQAVPRDDGNPQQLKVESQGIILISAAKVWGLTRLLERVSKTLVMSRT